MANSKIKNSQRIDTARLDPLEQTAVEIARVFDPYASMAALWNAQMAWLMHPLELRRAVNQLSGDVLALQAHIMRRSLGLPSEDVVVPHEDDTRFADPAWKESPTWDIIKEWYLAFTHRFQDMLFETPGLADKERRRAAFWARFWLNAMAPTNFFWTNPVALRRYAETQAQSAIQGFRNFMDDVAARDIRMTDPDAFKVGENLGTTPGSVVFRNDLLELIHYTPTTAKVHEKPILIVTPWINKFYVLDLTPKKSLVKFLTDQGFSVFITSWKNPTADMAEVSFDDYLTQGIQQAVDVVCGFCDVPRINLVGYCIGGTLAAAYMAWANRRFGPDKVPVSDWTLFTTLTDFSKPGDIEVFIDEPSVAKIEECMAQQGYLDGRDMAMSFRMLRSNSLIWNYVVDGYLLGEKPKAFDVLYWNMDTTRMPKAMHSYYLRNMYMNNLLIQRDALTIGDEPIDLDRIVQPLYMVCAEDDHIAPWRQCYRLRRHINVQAPMRFVLSSSGHILGIVNPPVQPPKRTYRTAEVERNESSRDWLERVDETPGSWWENWVSWLRERSGPMVSAYPAFNKRHPEIAPAPGVYVLEP